MSEAFGYPMSGHDMIARYWYDMPDLTPPLGPLGPMCSCDESKAECKRHGVDVDYGYRKWKDANP